jgi:hypothetical protein
MTHFDDRPRKKPGRGLATLLLAVAIVMLTAGMVLPQGLVLAAGVVLAGIAGGLLSTREGPARRPPHL